MTDDGLDRLADLLRPAQPILADNLDLADPETAFPPDIAYVAYDLLPEDLSRYPTGFNVMAVPSTWDDLKEAADDLAAVYRESATEVRVEYVDLPAGPAARVSGRIPLGPFDGFGQTYLLFGPGIEYQPYFETTWDQRDAFIPVFESIMRTFRPRPLEELPPPYQHADPELEALLPGTIDGRELATWSVTGEKLLAATGDCDPRSRWQAWSLMEEEGVDPDATSMAVAGRSQLSDPPYFVFALRFDEIAAEQVPLAFWFDGTSSAWRPAVIAGKAVSVGTKRMIAQDEHIRGRPYVYDLGAIRFVIVTDRREWAGEVLAVLP